MIRIICWHKDQISEHQNEQQNNFESSVEKAVSSDMTNSNEQQNEHQRVAIRTTNEQPSNTNKNYKNIKNVGEEGVTHNHSHRDEVIKSNH